MGNGGCWGWLAEMNTLKIQVSQLQVLDKEAQHLRGMLASRDDDVSVRDSPV